jgi:Tol biopolymer transport system component
MNARIYFPLFVYLIMLIIICMISITLMQTVGWLLHGDVVSYVSTRGGFGDIFLLDINTGQTLQITHDDASEEWARWSPDGQYIAYAADDRVGGLHIFVMDAYGRHIQQLTNGDSVNWFPTWSPDGTAFAVSSGRNMQTYNIFILNSKNGVSETYLPEIAPQDRVTSWYGNRLLFSAGESSHFEIYSVNADGSDLHQLTANGRYNLNAVWSPDGTRIAFQANLDGDFDLYLMNPNGTGLQTLTSDSSDEVAPMWSPDGTQIVYITISDPNFNYELYTINSDGTDIRRLTNNHDQDSSPAWMP